MIMNEVFQEERQRFKLKAKESFCTYLSTKIQQDS